VSSVEYWMTRAAKAEGWADAAELSLHSQGGDDAPWVILDSRVVVGNTPLFWMPNGNGYGSVITDIGRYSKEMAHSRRDTDVPIPLDLAVSCARPRIDIQLLNREMEIRGLPSFIVGPRGRKSR